MDRSKYDQKPQTPAVELASPRAEVAVATSLAPTPPSIHAVNPDGAVNDPKKVEDAEAEVAGSKEVKGNSAAYQLRTRR
jgi:hypothetical protein